MQRKEEHHLLEKIHHDTGRIGQCGDTILRFLSNSDAVRDDRFKIATAHENFLSAPINVSISGEKKQKGRKTWPIRNN
jgi:hypothetical protein